MMSSPLSQPEPWNLVAQGYAAENVAHFERYAETALELTHVQSGHRVVDIACGPGTLTRLAALRGAHVHALDFSEAMLTHLRQMVRDEGLLNVVATQGDGQNLPYADASFDRAFAMFAMMVYPDRAAGFRELQRVLAPAGQAVVSVWQPMPRVEVTAALFEALLDEAPELAAGPLPSGSPSSGAEGPAPLSHPEQLHNEMAAAGFEVAVHSISYRWSRPTMREYFEATRTSFPPLCLMSTKLGPERFEAVGAAVLRRLTDRFGDGPVGFDMPAWLAVGTKTL